MISLALFLALAFLAGALNANMDGLRHFKDRIIWQRWDNALTRWMLRGSNARSSIPSWLRWMPAESLVRAVWDGWHGCKSAMLALLLIGLPVAGGGLTAGLAALISFQVAFYLFYHHLLPCR